MDKNNQLLILIGIPASGKSTWAKSFIRSNADWVRVSRDDFRLMLKEAQMTEPKIEEMISTLVRHTIRESLMRKLNVIVDATNVRIDRIQEFVDEFKYYADVNYRVFDISLKVALERNKARDAKVPEAVIEAMHKQFKVVMDSFHFQPTKRNPIRERIEPDFKDPKPQAVIFDVDGTLANIGDRGIYDIDKVYKDHVVELVAEQVRYHREKGRVIIVVSGRDDQSWKMTNEWMELHNIKVDEFFMRPTGDMRKDSTVKKMLYDSYIKDRWNVLCVYDDRHQVLDMWHSEKIFTFNVNQGNYAF